LECSLSGQKFCLQAQLPFKLQLCTNPAQTVSLELFEFSHRVHNEVCPSCDIASQRMFRGGRTEYIRSPTNQALKFILAFDHPSVSVRSSNFGISKHVVLAHPCLYGVRWFLSRNDWNVFFQREAKLELFREAVDAYSALTVQVNNKLAIINCFCQLFLCDKQ